MKLNDIYISALKELNGFDEDAIEKAILLAKNDVVETVEEFIDFVNFNIEEKKFPNNATNDYTKSLTPNLSHLKKSIKSVELHDNVDMYIPERKDGILRVKLSPSKVFVMENGEIIEMNKSELWKTM